MVSLFPHFSRITTLPPLGVRHWVKQAPREGKERREGKFRYLNDGSSPEKIDEDKDATERAKQIEEKETGETQRDDCKSDHERD